MILITTELICDGNDLGCGVVFDTEMGPEPKRQWMRDRAAEAGWKRVFQEGRWLDLCPRCAAKRGARA